MFTAKIRIAFLLLVSASIGFAENLPLVITNAAEAREDGSELARQLREARPAENFTNTGVLKIRPSAGEQVAVPMRFEVSANDSGWQATYSAWSNRSYAAYLVIAHAATQVNNYRLGNINPPPDDTNAFIRVEAQKSFTPFARSDFWLCDLGLEFFHWPEQRVIRKEIRRSRSCKVLESINPNPATNAYSKVISWIDRESHGIVYAEAYDAGGKLLKEFEPRRFRKVEGQWQLQEMEIRNVQTGSRTRIEFDAPAE